VLRLRHIAPVALFLALAVAGFVVARSLAARDARRASEHHADVAAAQIRGRIEQATSLTESLRRYMLDAGGTGVTSDQFARNAFRWLSPADFSAASWIERVPASRRDAYERRLRQRIVTPDERHRVVASGSGSYLPATVVSGFPPMDVPGIDLGGEPGMASALKRATRTDGVAATPLAAPRTGTSGLFLVAPAPNLIDEVLRPGYVALFVPDQTLQAASEPQSVQIRTGGTSTGVREGRHTVGRTFEEAGQRFDVVVPRGSAKGSAALLPWIVLAAGLVLAGLAVALDLNASRRAKAQAELDRIFNLSSDLIAVADFEGRFKRVNLAVEQMLGYTREEFLAKPYLELVHPDDREKTAAEAAAIAHGKKTFSFENRYRHKDGSYRVLEWTSTPVVEDGLMYGVARDITARRKAEAQSARLGEEQAALRRVATLVAERAPRGELFSAVSKEVGRLFGTDRAAIGRFDPGGPAHVVVGLAKSFDGINLGSRFELDDSMTVTEVYRTRRPARRDSVDWSAVTAPIGEAGRRLQTVSSVSSPIIVEGHLWGAITVAATDRLPPLTEERLENFTELVATAIANAESRETLRQLAEEQAALRRVATLVASGGEPNEIFAAVGDEVRQLVGNDLTSMFRCEPGDMLTLVAVRARAEPVPDGLVGARIPMRSQFGKWLETGELVRLDERATAEWIVDLPAAEPLGLKSAIGAPIVVGGRPWGAIFACDTKIDGLPQEAQRPFEQFTELVATAIANAQSRSELNQLANEQAALRRVAELVAREASEGEIFNAIAEELTGLLGTDEMRMLRFDGGRDAIVVATAGSLDISALGRRFPLEGENVASLVARTGRPARIDDYRTGSGPIAEAVRSIGIRGVVGTPIVVQGRLWGTMVTGTSSDQPLPPDTESRLSQFTELMATAIANAEARAEVERLAEEQAALRRVATLVALGASPSAVLDAVAAELERILGADGVTLSRYEPDDEVSVVAHSASDDRRVPAGTRLSHRGENVTSLVRRTERSARMEHHESSHGAIAELARRGGVRASVGAPIIVDGRLWGVAVATWRGETSPPADTEERMAQFAELLDTAIANADSRNQLTASRARLVTEGDEARRRVVRDLHDGAQQRLAHTIVTLKLAEQALREEDGKVESLVHEALEHAKRSNAELRELAHGILPSVLTRGGLRAGVDTVVERVNFPVKVDIPDDRFAAEIEASAYFIVAEALTNVMKHSHAESAEIRASVGDGMLQLEVRDDGIGGADPGGHGLVGLRDRVTALGGGLDIESPPAGGTLVAAKLPLGQALSARPVPPPAAAP
jgi:PAS domain S-box-containing protein